MTIRNIVFDLGNVLLNYEPEKYLETFISSPDIRNAVMDAVFRSPEWKLADAGEVTDEQLMEAGIRRIPEYAEEVREAVGGWEKCLSPVSGMLEILKELKAAGYPLYLLSNISTRFHRFEKEYEEIRIMDGTLISADWRLVKPDERIYRLLQQQFHLTDRECLFIDDLQQNVEGAARAGMSSVLFTGAENLRRFLADSSILPD